MSTTKNRPAPPVPAEIVSAVLALNDSQRLALGHQLLDSVEVDPNGPDLGWPDGWEDELERRALSVEQGTPMFTLEEVIAKARESIQRERLARDASGVAP